MTNHDRYTHRAGRARRGGILLGLIILLTASPGRASAEGWNRSGLDGKRVFGLTVTVDGWILAATDAGIFRSTDNGASWTATDMTKSARAIEAAPNGDLFAAVSRTLMQDGLARSTDGGLTWQVNPVSERIRVMAVDSSGGVLIGGMSAVSRSIDGGAHWTTLPRAGMAEEFFDIMKLTVGPGGMIVAGNSGITGGMIYGSLDDGETWLELYRRQGDYGEIVFTPTGAIVATFDGGAIRSADYGGSWGSPASTGNGTITAIAFGAGAALAAGPNVVYRSTDDGATWSAEGVAPPAGTLANALVFAADGTPIVATGNGILRNGAAASAGAQSREEIAPVIAALPNPAVGRTAIQVALPRAGRLRMAAFDARGARMAEIADGVYEAGTARIDWETGELPAGVYRIRVEAGDRVSSTSVVVTR